MRLNLKSLAAAIPLALLFTAGAAHAYRIRSGLDDVWTTNNVLDGYDRDRQTLYRYLVTEDGVKPFAESYRGKSVQLDRQWTHIREANPATRIFYDSVNGVAKLLDHFAETRTYTDFRKGFDILEQMGLTSIYYDKQSGYAKIYKIDQYDFNALVQPKHQSYGAPTFKGTWRVGWDIIQPLPSRKDKHFVLFYDRDAGYAVIYDFPDSAKPGQRSYVSKSWRKTWHTILPYATSSACEYCQLVDNKQMILFYDNTKGEGSFYELDTKNGKIGKHVEIKRGWRKGWDTILSYSVGKKKFLLFYDKQSGDINVYKVKLNGTMGARVQ